MGKMKSACRILVEKPEGMGPLGGPRHRWEDNVKIKLKEQDCEGVDWTISFSRRTLFHGIFY
jgi:hypothetical protein